MNQETIEELYLSFAGVFQRPRREITDHLEELIDLWSEALLVPPDMLIKLKAFCEEFPSGEARLNALWEDYIPLFETGTVEASPYASVYLNEGGLVMGEETSAVLSFYEASGFGISAENRELADHLGVELEFSSRLVREGSWDRLEEFRTKHLLPFLQAILPKIKNSSRRFYSLVAELLEVWQYHLYERGVINIRR